MAFPRLITSGLDFVKCLGNRTTSGPMTSQGDCVLSSLQAISGKHTGSFRLVNIGTNAW